MTEAKVVSAHSHENSTGTKKHDVVFESAPSEEFYNTAGIVHGGLCDDAPGYLHGDRGLQHAGAGDSLHLG